MTERDPKSELGRVARISGEVRAAGAGWEVAMQRALLEDGVAQPGDDALLERCCESAVLGGDATSDRGTERAQDTRHDVQARVRARRGLARAMTYGAAAAALLVSFAAFGLGLRALLTSRQATPAARAAPRVLPNDPMRAKPLSVRGEAAPLVSGATLLLAPSQLATAAPAVGKVPESSTQLFASAKQAQRSGETLLAINRFEQLQQRFPLSAEAHVSRMVLGSLWMSRGNAAQALTQYQRYLERGGTLSEEALLGRARALGALGRAAEETQAWQALLKRYPDSVHSERARTRLRRLHEQP